MPSESDLRHLLQGPDPEGRAAIDLDAVLTRARRRRRPKVIAAQALGSVAVVGALFTAVLAVQPPQQAATMIAEDTTGGSEADAAPFVDESTLKLTDQCGLAPVASGPAVWRLDLATSTADSAGVTAQVTLALDGGGPRAEAQGTLQSLTVARDGVVVGTGFPSDVTGPVANVTGEGISWDARFDIVTCDGERLAPGAYEMRAVVVMNIDSTTGTSETVYGTPSVVEIG